MFDKASYLRSQEDRDMKHLKNLKALNWCFLFDIAQVCAQVQNYLCMYADRFVQVSKYFITNICKWKCQQ